MRPARVLAILRKDLVDALRDGRIVIALAVPIALAVFYNATASSADKPTKVDVGFVAPGGSQLPRALERVAGRGVELRPKTLDGVAAARRAVAADDVDLAVVLPRGVDAAVRDGRHPTVDVLLGPRPGSAAQIVFGLVDQALAVVAGRGPPAAVRLDTVRDRPVDAKPADVLAAAPLLVTFSLVFFALMVALLVVPIVIAEELETGTFDALRLAATGPEILLPKALVGLVYGLGGVALIVLITGVGLDDPVVFVGSATLLVVALTGFGLLLGVLARNANRINTFSILLIMPLTGAAIGVAFAPGGALGTLLDVLPISQASKLMLDAAQGPDAFGSPLLSLVVLLAWGVAGFAILARVVARREA